MAASDPLEKLSEQRINFGEHQMTFTDTTVAWQSFKQMYQNDIKDGEAATTSGDRSKQKKSDAFRNFQGLLEQDNGVTSDLVTSTLPDHARYDFVYYQHKETICEYCRKSTEKSDDRHACRICDRTFHEGCLVSRGFVKDELELQTLGESKTVLGWSCPKCEGLFTLLSNEEQDDIIELFTDVSGEDGVIDRSEFLQLQREEYQKLVGMEMPQFREKQELELFSKIDRDQTGTIDYWEFLPHIAVRFLSRRSPLEILNLLSPKEVYDFKEFFKEFDEDGKGAIQQSKAKQAYINWYKSKVKPCSTNYINYEWYGGLKENPLLKSLKETLSIENPKFKEEEPIHLIEWECYLKNCALHILSARANTGEQKPLIPPMPSFLYTTGGCSSGDDDFLNFCDEAKKWTNYLDRKGFKL